MTVNPGMDWEETDDVVLEAAPGAWGSAGRFDTGWYDAGSGETEYVISTAGELAGLARLVNAGHHFTGITIRLGADINLQPSGARVLDDDGQLNSEAAQSGQLLMWTPIGSYHNNYFEGVFDGQGHTVSGLYMPQYEGITNTRDFGLFGYAVNAEIKNLHVSDAYLHGRATEGITSLYVGGVVAECSGTDVSNCSVSGRVILDGSSLEQSTATKSFAVGGVVGLMFNSGSYPGTLSDCSFRGEVLGWSPRMGGVAGCASTVSNCVNYGTVANQYNPAAGFTDGQDGSTGGVVGNLDNGVVIGTTLEDSLYRVTGCANEGAVTGERGSVGGVVGKVRRAVVSGCANTGAVSHQLSDGSRNVCWIGGIVGSASGLGLRGCTNSGSVSAWDDATAVGGIVGNLTSYDSGGVLIAGEVRESVNEASVARSATSADSFLGQVGGIVGCGGKDCSVSACVNVGPVTSDAKGQTSAAGGIAGVFAGAVSESYSSADIAGYRSAGGVVGFVRLNSNQAASVTDCYNTGAVVTTCTGSLSGCVGGIVGKADYLSSSDPGSSLSLASCYNVGTVQAASSDSTCGGILGSSSSKVMTSVEGAYYLQGCGGSGVYGTPLTIEQMTSDSSWAENYTGFDSSTWGKLTNVNNPDGTTTLYLPHLVALVPGSGSAAQVAYVDDLAAPRSYPHLAGAVLAVTQEGWTYGEAPSAPSYEPPADDATTVALSYVGTTAAGTPFGPSAQPPTDAGAYVVTVSYEQDGTLYWGSVDFAVSQATPSGTPTCDPVSAAGTTLADVRLTGTFTGVDGSELAGTLAWEDPAQAVERGVAYGWSFTPDSANYAPISGVLTPWELRFGIEIAVSDADGGTPLSGVSFSLYRSSDPSETFDAEKDELLSGPAQTDVSGTVTLDGIKAGGTYWVVQESAPAGYVTHAPMRLEVDAETGQAVLDGNTNNPIVAVSSASGEVFRVALSCAGVPSLPETGGLGAAPLYLAGMAAVAAAIVVVRRE